MPSDDPKLQAGLAAMQKFFPQGLDVSDIAATRAMLAHLQAKRPAPRLAEVTIHDVQIPVQPFSAHRAGEPTQVVTLRCYQPLTPRTTPRPALLWCHGGGFMFGELSWDDKRCQQMAVALDCVVVAVDYRLAPEQPFPAALEDGYAALCWMADHAASLGIDGSRIAVAGASAGGGLAAGLALLARDRGQPALCFQLLLYPMLDDRTVVDPSALGSTAAISVRAAPPTPGWSLVENTAGWQCYLGIRTALRQCSTAAAPACVPEVSPYAAPSRANDLSALPPAFIAVGSIDLFYGECCEYAARLQQAGVAVELQCYANAFHGFDSWASASSTAQRCWAEQCAALQQAFYATRNNTI